MVERFAPTVVMDGRTVTPEGWMWVLGFALGGCEWAIKEANTESFKKMVRERLVIRSINSYKRGIQQKLDDIKEFQAEIDRLEKMLEVPHGERSD
jgi:hypothetical protein